MSAMKDTLLQALGAILQMLRAAAGVPVGELTRAVIVVLALLGLGFVYLQSSLAESERRQAEAKVEAARKVAEHTCADTCFPFVSRIEDDRCSCADLGGAFHPEGW